VRPERQGIYRLRKWYADLLTPAGDYGFIYLADVMLLGAAFRSLTLHLARSAGGAPVTKTIPLGRVEESPAASNGRTFDADGGRIAFGDGDSSVDIAGSGLAVRLRFVPVADAPALRVDIGTGGTQRIVWRPIHLKSAVSGSIAIGDDHIEAAGCNGYIDYLESSFLPPIVPVRTLVWGRLHHPELDLVFMNAATGSGGTAWSRMAIHAGGRLSEWEGLEIVTTPDPLETASTALSQRGYCIHASCGARRAHVTVHHAVPVQVSSFIDHQELRSASLRFVLKTLTRNPRSTKWLSYADVVLEDPESPTRITGVPMIDEYACL
jgi:hypothetical protein